MISPQTKEVLSKFAARRKRYKRLFQVIYTIFLVLAIFIIWICLIVPITVGALYKSPPTNITRPYVELLNNTITTNTSILPQRCHSGNESAVHSNITITCPTNYVFNCTMCIPICGLWHPYGESYFTAYRVTTIITSVAQFIFSFIGFIVLLKVPGSFKVPQINYLFMFFNAVIFNFLLAVIAISGPYNFFCQRQDEDYSIVAQDPPVYVSVVGFVMHFAYLSFNFWFVCATVNLMIIVLFPQLRITESRKSQIVLFTIEATISFAFSLIIPSIFLIFFKHYSFFRTPHHPYPADPIIALIFIVVPLLLSTAVSLTIIVIALYKLQMRKLSFIENKENAIKLEGFEIRLIIFTVCLGLVAFIALFEGSYYKIFNAIFEFKLEEFWSCLTVQNNLKMFHQVSSAVCPTEYRAFSFPIFNFIRYFALTLWTFFLLVILTTKETREEWKKIFTKLFHVVSRTKNYFTLDSRPELEEGGGSTSGESKV